jgi:hypothetical protein
MPPTVVNQSLSALGQTRHSANFWCKEQKDLATPTPPASKAGRISRASQLT